MYKKIGWNRGRSQGWLVIPRPPAKNGRYSPAFLVTVDSNAAEYSYISLLHYLCKINK